MGIEMTEDLKTPEYKGEWTGDSNNVVRFMHHSSRMQEVWNWCRDNCTEKWYVCQFNPFYLYFDSNDDAMLFKLTWGLGTTQ